jgi:WD40 repeat protein
MKSILQLLPERKEECILIENAFSNEFCSEIIKRFSSNFKQAKTHYPTSYRNNERYVIDDKKLSEQIFKTIQKYIPSKIVTKDRSFKENGDWELGQLNHRIRVCRYLPNQYFNKHLDGVHYQSEIKQSKLTFMIYLNSHKEFSGGKTLFFTSKEDESIMKSYKPNTGDVMIFDHNLWHAGEEVFKGEKYVLRSDVLYNKTNHKETKYDSFCDKGHLGYIWTITEFKNKLITGGRDKKIKIWSNEGKIEDQLTGHKSSILSIIAQNGDTIISCSRDQLIKLWKFKKDSFKLYKSLQPHEGTILCLYKINDNEFLSGGADGMINQIDIHGNIIYRNKAHDEWIWSIVEINKEVYATVSEDGSVKLWTIKDHQLIAKWKGSIPINSICVSNHIFIGRLDGSIVKLKFDIQRKELSVVIKQAVHLGIIRVLKAYENIIISGSEDRKIKVSKSESLECLKEFEHKNFVQDLLIVEDEIISVSYDGEINKNSL